MKKLFFTAHVVVIAIGGAFAHGYYLIGSSEVNFYCPDGIITCDARYGYDAIVSPDAYPIQLERFHLSVIPWDGLN